MALKVPKNLLTPQICQYFRQLFEFEEKLTYHQQQHGAIARVCRFYREDENYLYLPLARARQLLPAIQFPQYPRADFQFTGTLLPEQVEVCREIWPVFSTEGSCLLNLPTAFGKSVVGAFLASQPGGNVAVLVAQEHLILNFVNVFLKYTTARYVLAVEDKKGPPDDRCQLREYKRQFGRVPQVLVIFHTRVNWVPDDIKAEYEVLMVDEAHCWCTELRGQLITTFLVKYLIAMTATLIKKNGLDVMMRNLCAGIVQRKLSKPFTLVKVETGIQTPHFANQEGHMNWAAVSEWIKNCHVRNLLIACLIQFLLTIPWTGAPDEVARPRKILLICYRNEHVDYLSNFLTSLGIKNSIMKGGVNTYQDSMVLVGNYDKIGTGFDEENACPDFNGIRFNTIILCSSIKDHTILEQCLGRVFRVFFPDIFDLVDRYMGPKKDNFAEHFKERYKWYKDHNLIEKSMDFLAPAFEMWRQMIMQYCQKE